MTQEQKNAVLQSLNAAHDNLTEAFDELEEVEDFEPVEKLRTSLGRIIDRMEDEEVEGDEEEDEGDDGQEDEC